MKIGYYGTSYPDRRLIIDQVPGVEYRLIENRKENFGRVLNQARKVSSKFGRTEFYAQNSYFTLEAKEYPELDVLHTFNRVCLNENNRWVCTFEKTLPAFFSDELKLDTGWMKKQLPHLLSDRCRRLLPISEWAKSCELELLARFATADEIKALEGKMQVLYPPQRLLTKPDELEEKFAFLRAGNVSTMDSGESPTNGGASAAEEHRPGGQGEKLRFLYVGRQMKRKGGLEVLKAFDRLSRETDNFQVVFVGDVEDKVNAYYLDEEEKRFVQRVRENADWLEYYDRLPNEEIIRLAKRCHVGLLPTLGDTFGFSILEMQACGCPVITTNRMALPEINREDCGWLINTKKCDLRHRDDYANYSREEVNLLSLEIQRQLPKILEDILEHPKQIRVKAEKALERVRQEHDPDEYAERLREVYEAAR